MVSHDTEPHLMGYGKDKKKINTTISIEILRYLQSHDILGTIISKLILNLCPLDVSTNNSSEILGDMYVCSSDSISMTIINAPTTVTRIINNN